MFGNIFLSETRIYLVGGHSSLWQSAYCLRYVCTSKFIHGIWNQWPHSPSPIQLSIICSILYVLPATHLEPVNKNTHSVLTGNQNPAYLWLQLRSDLQANFLLQWRAFHMYSTTLVTCNLQSLPHREHTACSNCWYSVWNCLRNHACDVH